MTDLAILKSDIDKLDFEKLKNVPSNLSNLKSKEDKLGVDKLVPVLVYLSKLSDVIKKYVVKNMNIMLRLKILKEKYLIFLTWVLILLLMLK